MATVDLVESMEGVETGAAVRGAEDTVAMMEEEGSD